MIIDKKSCFKCGKFTYKNTLLLVLLKRLLSFSSRSPAVGFSVDGRQCWPPTWPIGFSHLDTSRCRTDPALPTATSSIDLEHILHIPATILQASVGSILSAPGQHCRPIMNSRGHTPGTEQTKTQGKGQWEREVWFWEQKEGRKSLLSPQVTQLPTWQKNQRLLPRTKHLTHTGYWPKKSPQNSL